MNTDTQQTFETEAAAAPEPEPGPRRDATVMELAQVIADSRAFPACRSPAAAAVRILAGREMGVGPIAAVGGIRVENGRVSMDAVLMAGCIRRSEKYDYRVAEHTAELCRLEFTRDGKPEGVSEFGIANAKAAGLLGTKGEVWQKYPRNMLFARALSNGARWYCPDIFGGSIYTHEEIGVAVDGDGAAAGDNGGGPAGTGNDLCTREQRQEIARLTEAAGTPLAELLDKLGVRMLDELSGYEAGKWIKKLAKKTAGKTTPAQDVPAAVGPGSVQDAPAPASSPAVQTMQEAFADANRKSTASQRSMILHLAQQLEPDEAACLAGLREALARRNAAKIADLTFLQAAALIEAMEARLAAVDQEPPFDPGPSQEVPNAAARKSSATPQG